MTATEPTIGLRGVDRVPPQALLVVSITSVQFGAAVAVHLFTDVGPAGSVLLRLGFAAIGLCLVFRPQMRGLSRERVRLAALFGAVMGAMNLSFYEALDRLPLGIAVTIEFLGPLGVAVALSRRRLDLVWAALAGTGVLILAHPGGGGIDTAGLVFVLIAATMWAAYILVAKRVGEHFDGGDGISLAMIFATALVFVPGVVGGGTDLLEPHALALGLAVALLSTAIPYTLEVEALRRLPANVFGVFMSLEPAVAALAGFVVLGQTLGATDLVAIALVVAASLGASLSGAPARPPET